MNFKGIQPIIFALLVLLLSCEKPKRDNPWDEKANINPAAWAPQNLQIDHISPVEKKLSWTYAGDDRFEGFKLDRKKGDEAWQLAYQTFPKETRSWNDVEITPDSMFTYSYRLYAFAGQQISEKQSVSASAEFAAPSNLKIINNSITSVTLSWKDNSTGEEGYKIERKYRGGIWDSLTTVTGNSFEDNNFDLNTYVYYRICVFYGSYTSNWSEENFDSSIPVPENFNIIPNTVTSVQLTWEYSHTGHDGFKIDRKVNSEAWVTIARVIAGQNDFADDGINLHNNSYSYRICSCHRSYSSQYKEKAIEFVCGFTLITDNRDGKQYETVQIGNQCWMKENMAYLPSVSPSSSGSNTTPYYYVHGYQGTSVPSAKATSSYQTYGVLYNWPAAATACPSGWHLPTDNEWAVLTNYLGDESVAGGKMKETGTSHWNSPNEGATNSSGFTALPGGVRGTSGLFDWQGSFGYWWSSSDYDAYYAWYRRMYKCSGYTTLRLTASRSDASRTIDFFLTIRLLPC